MYINKLNLPSCYTGVWSLFFAALLTACSQAPNEQSSINYESATQETDLMADSNTTTNVEELGGQQLPELTSKTADINVFGKQLIINASVDFTVDDVVKTRNIVEQLTQQHGGYVAQSDLGNQILDRQSYNHQQNTITLVTYVRQAHMTVRIPRSKVNTFLQKVQRQVLFLNEQHFSAKNVTLDIYAQQLEASLNNQLSNELEKQRLKNNKAKAQYSNMDAITATYQARQREQYAEIMKKRLQDQVQYSTITLNFKQPNSVYKETTQNLASLIKNTKPSFSEQMSYSLHKGWDNLLQFIFAVIKLWGLWLFMLLAYVIYRIFRYYSNNKSNPKS